MKKSIDIIILFIFMDRLKNYDSKLYFELKSKFINYWKTNNTETILIKDLKLNKEQLENLNYYYNYLDIDNLNINEILKKIF